LKQIISVGFPHLSTSTGVYMRFSQGSFVICLSALLALFIAVPTNAAGETTSSLTEAEMQGYEDKLIACFSDLICLKSMTEHKSFPVMQLFCASRQSCVDRMMKVLFASTDHIIGSLDSLTKTVDEFVEGEREKLANVSPSN